jgi:Tol biopolymer transport system component
MRASILAVSMSRKAAMATRGLYTMDPDGRDQRLLSSFSRDDHFWYNNLSWSPDGSQILYGVSAIGYPTPVVVVGVDGSEPRVLAERGSDWGRGRMVSRRFEDRLSQRIRPLRRGSPYHGARRFGRACLGERE